MRAELTSRGREHNRQAGPVRSRPRACSRACEGRHVAVRQAGIGHDATQGAPPPAHPLPARGERCICGAPRVQQGRRCRSGLAGVRLRDRREQAVLRMCRAETGQGGQPGIAGRSPRGYQPCRAVRGESVPGPASFQHDRSGRQLRQPQEKRRPHEEGVKSLRQVSYRQETYRAVGLLYEMNPQPPSQKS